MKGKLQLGLFSGILIWNRGAAAECLIAERRLPVPGGNELGTIKKLGAVQKRSGKIGAIEADFNGVALGTARDQIYALPGFKNLPQGVHIVETGDAQIMGELFVNFTVAMTTGILMVFAVLVLLFARVLQPITILSSLPLSLGGAVLALTTWLRWLYEERRPLEDRRTAARRLATLVRRVERWA